MKPVDDKLNQLTQAQRERLAHIEFTLMFKGEAGRQYLTERFNVAPSVVTQDFARYRELAPDNVVYDEKKRLHIKSSEFSPIFQYDVIRTLSTLSQGFGDGFLGKTKVPTACEAPYHLNKPDLVTIATISEAIHKKLAVKIDYISLSSGLSQRVIVPHTLIDNGLRWHIRAFDHKSGEFRDFVLTRIKKISLLDNTQYEVNEDSETVQYDKQWNRIVELEFIPHPTVPHPEAIELDYGMASGQFKVELRAVFVGYLLRVWNIDCSKQQTMTGNEFHLALNNPEALYGVENAGLAPGFEP